MSHEWVVADENFYLQDLINLTENNKHIDIGEPDEFGFGSLQVAKDSWVNLQCLDKCSNCGVFEVSDISGDYSDIIGGDYNCINA